jgi:hypothetical protein
MLTWFESLVADLAVCLQLLSVYQISSGSSGCLYRNAVFRVALRSKMAYHRIG